MVALSESDVLLRRTQQLAQDYLDGLSRRAVAAPVDMEKLQATLGGPLGNCPVDPVTVLEELAQGVDSALVATSGGRFFGFVEGGVLPAALAADWLTTTWDQNPGLHVLSPAAAAVEEITAGWLLDLLGLPSTASLGFTTGAQMANFAGLAAARHDVLAKAGWDVEADGLTGAPPVTVLVGAESHITIGRALRFLGMGERTMVVVAADSQGRMDADALRRALKQVQGPSIVCSQAGNVNTGAFDPLPAIAQACRDRGAWLHVDGAFGLWAAASPARRHLVDGVELADSWATDGHKWLNVPYDSGFVACAHPESHRTAMAVRAPYLVRAGDGTRDGTDWTPESSRRARAFAVWAALRSLGREGVAALVDRCCDHAARFAEILSGTEDLEVLNDVVLNQVLVRVGDDDSRTKGVAAIIQDEGEAWLGDTVWQDKAALRISVSDHATTTRDVDRAIAAIIAAAAATRT
ncbi:MAG: aminotransferase class V-fold PLP-dependent enzyme [Actinomycetota bacterium]|nr:aminotransferase class V-fold PLP-dependent enzyme [Actinomycetota bacterium]